MQETTTTKRTRGPLKVFGVTRPRLARDRIIVAESRMTSKGQLTVPKAIRNSLNLESGDRVSFVLHPGGSVRFHAHNLKARDVAGMLKPHAKFKRPVTIEEMDAGIAEAVRKRALRSGGRLP